MSGHIGEMMQLKLYSVTNLVSVVNRADVQGEIAEETIKIDRINANLYKQPERAGESIVTSRCRRMGMF